jgi:hypothetical protein
VVEYGGGINEGPAGQVGGGGAPSVGGGGDPFANVGNLINDAASFIGSQPLEVLVAGFFVVLLGLVILKRAF